MKKLLQDYFSIVFLNQSNQKDMAFIIVSYLFIPTMLLFLGKYMYVFIGVFMLIFTFKSILLCTHSDYFYIFVRNASIENYQKIRTITQLINIQLPFIFLLFIVSIIHFNWSDFVIFLLIHINLCLFTGYCLSHIRLMNWLNMNRNYIKWFSTAVAVCTGFFIGYGEKLYDYVQLNQSNITIALLLLTCITLLLEIRTRFLYAQKYNQPL